MAADASTIGRLKVLLQLYQAGYQSATIDKTVEKLTALETTRLEKEEQRLRERLDDYEKQYGMSTEAFYKKITRGELGDEMDFVEWSIFWDMYRNTQARLQMLSRSSRALSA